MANERIVSSTVVNGESFDSVMPFMPPLLTTALAESNWARSIEDVSGLVNTTRRLGIRRWIGTGEESAFRGPSIWEFTALCPWGILPASASLSSIRFTAK